MSQSNSAVVFNSDTASRSAASSERATTEVTRTRPVLVKTFRSSSAHRATAMTREEALRQAILRTG